MAARSKDPPAVRGQSRERTSLRAVSRLIKRGKRQDVAEVCLYDGEGRLVAHATGTFLLLPGVSQEKPGAP